MANLYEINREILACLDLNTGEILDVEKLEALNIEKTQKIENIVFYIKNLKSDVAAFENEEEAFAERKMRAEKKIENLQQYLISVLDGENFSTTKCAVNFRKSERVNVVDKAQIPREFIKITTTENVDKTAVKAAIKAGQAVDGCQLIENLNISVK